MSSDKFFEYACEILDVTECSKNPNDRYTDPCNCYDTYFCLNYEVVRERCAQGNAFDGKKCDHDHIVLLNSCDVDQPWLRCNVSDERLTELPRICGVTTSTYSQSTTEDLTPTHTTKSPGGDNLGLIIGLVVAGVVIVLFAAILAGLVLKRKKTINKLKRDRLGTVQNPEYFENGNRDDPYSVIDDSRHTPRHVSSYRVTGSNAAPMDGILHGRRQASTLPPNLEAVHDNSSSRTETPSGYDRVGNTIRPETSRPRYFTLTTERYTEHESNNNTPTFSGQVKVQEREIRSVVNDDALQIEPKDSLSDRRFEEVG